MTILDPVLPTIEDTSSPGAVDWDTAERVAGWVGINLVSLGGGGQIVGCLQ